MNAWLGITRIGNAIFLAFAFISIAQAEPSDTVGVVQHPPIDSTSALYISNKAPLAPSPLIKLPVGSITPKGWLRHQLLLEADGMAGRLEEVSPWLKFDGNAWTDSKGLGKNGWEEVPYWLKGYGDLGYVLKDPKIIANAKRWIDAIIATQAEDGWFGPVSGRTSLHGKPDMWPAMPVLNALQSYYEFTGDPRVIALMTRYFKYQLDLPDADMFTGYWDKMRTGDNLESVYWLYNRTGDKWLLDLATKIHKHAAEWEHKVPNWHNVNVAQGFREPAEFGVQAKDPALYEATVHDYDTVMGMYGQVPGGGFGGDENCRPGYTDPRQAFETCGMVEFMHSFEMLAKISGDPLWADRCEEIAFNSLPAALTPDLKALHYLTSPNMVQLDRKTKSPGLQNGGTMVSYSPYGVYRCCQHNHAMGWPYYAEELWHATSDGGLCATMYGACDVTAKVADGSTVTIAQATDYPFSESVQLKVSTEKPARFPLYLRVPRWCGKPGLTVNGNEVPMDARPSSYIAITRTWADGDTIALSLPMHLSVRTWSKNKNAVSVDYGPVTFSLEIGQKWVKYGGNDTWPEMEVYPTTPWNYGLVLNAAAPTTSFEVIHKSGPLADQPFTPEATPILLRAKAKKIENWATDKRELIQPLQPSPVKSDQPVETVSLIPMGAARLRISAFPVIGDDAAAHEWPASPELSKLPGATGQARASASHCFDLDTVDALNDAVIPVSSADHGIARFTWWDHRGSAEWVQYEWKEPHTLSGVSVYWFDDTGIGRCRVPKSWRVVYREAGEKGKDAAWIPVQAAAPYSVNRDAFNDVKFKPVQASALRIEVQLQDGMSGGVLKWRVAE